MKKLIFISTMFLISVSANSQIMDCSQKGSLVNCIDENQNNAGSFILKNGEEFVGFCSSAVAISDNEHNSVRLFKGNGEFLSMISWHEGGYFKNITGTSVSIYSPGQGTLIYDLKGNYKGSN
jgi:hypothetical protein